MPDASTTGKKMQVSGADTNERSDRQGPVGENQAPPPLMFRTRERISRICPLSSRQKTQTRSWADMRGWSRMSAFVTDRLRSTMACDLPANVASITSVYVSVNAPTIR
jgi:hypothetical protein